MNQQAAIIRVVAVGISIAWTATLYLSGVDLAEPTRRLLAYLPTVAVILAVAFDLWLWKLPLMNRIVGRPRLDGTWRTTLTPNPESHIPDGGNRGPVQALTCIEQTYWTMSVSLLTAQSRSQSTTAALAANPDSKSTKRLYFTYRNDPQLAHRPRSLAHLGSCELAITGHKPTRIDGMYWTNRLTMGDLCLELIDRRTDHTLDEHNTKPSDPSPSSADD